MKRRKALKNTALLFGTAFSATTIASLLESCSQPTEPLDWQPVFLSPENGQMLTQITDILIPSGEVEGAVESAIPQLIDLFAKGFMSIEEQTNFKDGFTELAAKVEKETGKSFIKNDRTTQLAILQKEEKIFVESPTPTFFGNLKELIYKAYFNSEVGATQVLKYDPIPGTFAGCIPFSEVNGTWVSLDNFVL